FQRGVCLVGPPRSEETRRVKALGAEWVSLTPFGYGQREPDRVPEGGYRLSRWHGESPADIRRSARLAHEHGLKVIVKPHLWFRVRGTSHWRGDIAFARDEDWTDWFEVYRAFLAPFLEIAAEERVEAFCLGTELKGTTGQTGRWLELIAEARKGYAGKLTYAAHWDHEFESIRFWRELDFIGVQGYFPLVDFDDRNPTAEELDRGWKPWMEKLEAVSVRAGRPVLFTELGYKPCLATTYRPWEWRSRGFDSAAQADALEAFFRQAKRKRFIAGVHIWKWFTRGRRRDFSPQGLAAEEVLRRWFGG
ncbi:MAG: hypothetical protein ACE5F1_01790, partial [Planctomycetota bacterium]